MADQVSGKRFTAILWFVAGGLAFLAVGIRFTGNADPNWAVAAGGLFCVVMGISAWSRSRQPPGTQQP
jgi:hypothetical protein